MKNSPAQAQQPLKPLAGGSRPSNLRLMLLAGIAAITFLCYNYTLHNHFTNWDDGLYVETNPYIKNLTSDNIKMILFHNITNNYYHPITMLTIAANYHNGKMEPFGYYLTNVTMHVLNTCLTFFLIFILLEAMEEKGYGRMQGKEWLAAFGALCYGIHPMHVESVSWLAERKDVMYAFFYFMGLIVYTGYLRGGRIKWYDTMASLCLLIVSFVFMWGLLQIKYMLTFFGLLAATGFGVWYIATRRDKEKSIGIVFLLVFPLFICSLLSKPLAVVFPFSLLAIDVLLRRDKEKPGLWNDVTALGSLLLITVIVMFELATHNVLDNVIANVIVFPLLIITWLFLTQYLKKKTFSLAAITKFPFFLVSVVAGIWAWHAQKASGSVASFHTFSVLERLTFAAYGFTMYAVKAFVPLHLCSYYPSP